MLVVETKVIEWVCTIFPMIKLYVSLAVVWLCPTPHCPYAIGSFNTWHWSLSPCLGLFHTWLGLLVCLFVGLYFSNNGFHTKAYFLRRQQLGGKNRCWTASKSLRSIIYSLLLFIQHVNFCHWQGKFIFSVGPFLVVFFVDTDLSVFWKERVRYHEELGDRISQRSPWASTQSYTGLYKGHFACVCAVFCASVPFRVFCC